MAGKYDSIVYDYFEKANGYIILISEDPLFKRMLSSTIFKVIGTKRDCLSVSETVHAGLKKVQAMNKLGQEFIVFIERMIGGNTSTDTILTLKRLLPELKIIVLVGETKRENIAFFYEIGVANVISKPASMNNIIEKLAFTVKPQGKLSEYMDHGKRSLASGKLMDAMKIAQKVLAIKPESPAGLMLKGDVHLAQNEMEKALESYHRAHESSKIYLEPIKKLVDAYRGVDENEMLKYMKKLDRLSPLNAQRKTEIGKVHVKRREMDMAEAYFDQAIETVTREAMGMISAVAENISEAVADDPGMSEKYLTKVLEAKGSRLDKDDISLFNKLGIALRGQGKWREAIDNYAAALRISPKDEGLHYNMGMAFYDGGDKRRAGQCFMKALEHNPEFYKRSEAVSMNLGTLFADLREYEYAIPCFENALALNPENSTAARKLASLKESAR
ncbi:MAG: tetratricopeptide repeat protein [Pseudodesulfovibrio sp.]|uniref:tetratricopeptide repeat protein n=1 Tax=Pseudodesulfovibrio sp. TaxID=2035812 RepID=UPI003D13D2A7